MIHHWFIIHFLKIFIIDELLDNTRMLLIQLYKYIYFFWHFQLLLYAPFSPSSPMCSNIFFFFFLRLILLCSSPPANWRENNRGVAAVGSYTDLIVCSLNETRTTLMMMMMMMVAVLILVMVMMTMVLMVILVMMMFATTKP